MHQSLPFPVDFTGTAKLHISKSNFRYEITYHDNEVMMEATHTKEHFQWKTQIMDPLQSENLSGDNQLINTISPKIVFKLLKNYHDGDLKPIHEFIFPEGYKNEKAGIQILLITTLEDMEIRDQKTIYLEPVDIPDSQRINVKLLNTKKEIKHRFKVKFIEMFEKMAVLEAELAKAKKDMAAMNQRIESLDNELDTTFETYATKDDLLKMHPTKNEMTSYVKQEMANCPVKSDLAIYVTKNEMTSYVQHELTTRPLKTDLANYATKSELANCATKAELANYAPKTV